MRAYAMAFARYKLNVAQLLLTHGDLDSQMRRANAKNTLERLLDAGDVVPIINENDSVAVEELNFGDNDRLSADVAVLAGADLLIILTQVDGLLDSQGRRCPIPVGEVLRKWAQPNGIEISKVRVPIGIIYESRPNVTSDAAVLCTKTGNGTILRGGSESIHSNVAIAEALQRGGAAAGLPPDSILLIPQTDREAVRHMAEMDRYIDLIIPRGGHALMKPSSVTRACQ